MQLGNRSLSAPILEARHVSKYFALKKSFFSSEVNRAVHDISFTLSPGETLGIVGESGSGKSTLGRTIMRLYEPTEGQIIFEGRDISHISESEMRPLRREIQMVFQDPYSSLNPRMRVEDILTEPFIIHRRYDPKTIRGTLLELLTKVGLRPDALRKYPHEFSGGQRQRIGIARAITLRPKVIIADEPVSALDVSIQAQILNLLKDLQEDMGLAYVFISHDLGVIDFMSHHVLVMHLGKVVEFGEKDAIIQHPKHEYTQALLRAVPKVPEITGN